MKTAGKILFSLLLLSQHLFAQDDSLFTPARENALRLPSVPLVTVDPYFSLWSQYNHLYDGQTEHWSNHTPKPLTGAVRVDGQVYRFMGVSYETVLPMADESTWTGQYTMSKPSGTWYEVDYNDSAWSSGKAAFGGNDDNYHHIGTKWADTNSEIWVRRTFDMDEVDENGFYAVIYRHDDTFELYLNGERIANTGYQWNVSGVTLKIDRSLLRTGRNVLAAHCINTMGGAYVDFGLYRSSLGEAVQKSCVVMPTSTYYTFQCGAVDVDLVFTAPQIMWDLDLFSTPINYISYRVRSNDEAAHDVQFYLDTTPQLTVRNTTQTTRTNLETWGALMLLRAGNTAQTPLNHGDDIIDWGYLYLAADTLGDKRMIIGTRSEVINEFARTGQPTSELQTYLGKGGEYCAMACVNDLGSVDAKGKTDFAMIGYDDVFSIQYHGTNRKAYWAHNGRVNIKTRFEDFHRDYDSIMALCRGVDARIWDDAYESAGKRYAEICSSVYRQANAAHKLITDTKGNLMFMSKENTSGGFINTLDVTYPSSSIYLIYNTDLIKAMLTPVYEYSTLGKWTKGFANHDLGGYPKANGQTYGGDMPVEESGNVLILTAAIARMDGDMAYVRRYWKLMTKWTDYLVEHGRDPSNQLCTDDFMGTSERNTNLAVKAIMGVASYSELARMQGLEETAEEYMAKAQDMVDYWVRNAFSTTGGTHYLLNFGAARDTWSNKYNMVWDKVWGWDLFKAVRNREMSFYQGKLTTYGLPLDNRSNMCKNDWHMWTAAMTENNALLNRFINPMWKFINECPTRVPVTDCHDCGNAGQRLFHARSVVGGYWMKVFVDQFLAGRLTPTNLVETTLKPATPLRTRYYDLQGRQWNEPVPGNIYIRKQEMSDGSVRMSKMLSVE